MPRAGEERPDAPIRPVQGAGVPSGPGQVPLEQGAAAPHLAASELARSASGFGLGPQEQVERGLAPQGNLRSIDMEHPGVPSWRLVNRPDPAARHEPEFHQAPGDLFRKIDSRKNPFFSLVKLRQAVRMVALSDSMDSRLFETVSHFHYGGCSSSWGKSRHPDSQNRGRDDLDQILRFFETSATDSELERPISGLIRKAFTSLARRSRSSSPMPKALA
ncbi:MAG: hypothetical protein DIJKHBIC_01787 [Thermoanaerobaculia bacterium]|nr:hypothetical protein [Thermoanaerobaculia bacterium]